MNETQMPDPPVGLDTFREFRETGAYYVDKTRFIGEFLRRRGTKFTLITRPRRFGKTLLMDMVKEFFDMTSDASDLFEGLYAQELYSTHGHSNPVLPLSFAGVSGSKRNIVLVMKDILSRAFRNFPQVTEALSGNLKQQYEKLSAQLDLMTDDFETIGNAIVLFTEILATHYGKDVLLLIDEYDTPMQAAWLSGCYGELRPFFSTLYGNALKGNRFIEKALLTGIQRMAKESIFSGLNNPSVCTMADTQYADCFGFTEAETETMLSRFGLTLTDEVKARYDGYRIGGVEIYNPWAIANYCDKRIIQSFWSESASSTMIREKMENASAEFLDLFHEIVRSGKARVYVNMGNATFESSDEPSLWGMLVNSGYLTFAPPDMPTDPEDTMELRIPNGDVADGFVKLLSNNQLSGNRVAHMFRRLYVDRNTASFAKEYQSIILKSTSFFSVGEDPYRMFMLGMSISMGDLYEIKSEQEQGIGRSDVSMRSLSPKRINIIMEFKYDSDGDPKVLAKVALSQILDKKYHIAFEGETLLIGIGHRGKECALEFAWEKTKNSL